MSFKTVELLGFKSFADKLEIKFGAGLTCIVGPNGCGKSNVADAIRWVLGEQSAKTLRGGSMADVIFNGTQLRKSLSYCEVSLCFDNTSKMFDLSYNEVVFTRKLYRSGESEYLINRQPCRLKDIVKLLQSVGLGKDGYSIIGQNRISEIMNSKPLERRGIFEEATGISGFRTKKNETERRLSSAAENLERYKDIMEEVARRLSPLEKQAESARKYYSLAEQLKTHEINSYLYKHENAEGERKKINLRLDGIAAESENKRSDLNKAQKDYEAAFLRGQSMDSELYELQEKLREKSVFVEKQQGEAKIYNERISALNSEIVRNKEHINSGEERLLEIETCSISNSAKVTELERELSMLNLEIAKLNTQSSEVANLIKSFETAADENRDQMISTIESLADIRTSAGSLLAEKQTLIQRKDELEQRASELSEKIKTVSSALSNISKSRADAENSTSNARTSYTQKLENQRQLNADSAQLENQIYLENTNFSTLEANGRMLQSVKESYGGYVYAIKHLMGAAKDDSVLAGKIKGVIADIIKTDADYETAIETAIGGAMQNIVTDSSDDARYLIEYLKKTKGGTVTFLPVRSVKPRFESPQLRQATGERGAIGSAIGLVKFDTYYENIIKFLLGNTLICDNIASANDIAKKYSNAFKIVTLEGDIVNTSGSMTGGYKKAESVNLLSNERRLEETLSALEKSRKSLQELKEKKSDFEQKKRELSKELEEISQKYTVFAQNVSELKVRQEAAETSLSELQNELESIYRTVDAITIRLEKISGEQSAQAEGKLVAERQRDLTNTEFQKSREQHEGLKQRRERLNSALSEAVLKSNTASLEIENLRTENKRLIDEKAKTEQLLSNFQTDILEKQKSITSLKAAAEAAVLGSSELEELEAERQAAATLNEEKKQIALKIAEFDQKKDSLTQEITRLNEKKHLGELALSKIDSELDAMRERIWEEYQATYENSVHLKVENYDAQSGRAETARLKREITALGNINYNAIEDYNEQSARYKEMQEHKEDLTKAHEDLSKILKDLKVQMQKQFDEGFELINESFKRTFKELFGGGRAQLQMDYTDDCVDPLEAGVEIVAEPPGKKLQKISLLSGGEQALTAIAILFAILSQRAMPFCVLDEIEAALDEANVDRFAKYLKSFAKETQFIVITHRKPTMELADALYGVTMEEKGVSRMVSVKLSDIEDQLDIA